MKPIAWMSPDGKVSKTEGKLFYIPLYAAQKPLSDEEIDKIIYSVDWAYDPVLLARAIEERHGIK